jgi:zinc transporter 1/2/3
MATPLGILAGALVRDLLRSVAGQYFDAAFLALAGGTFLYIASMDILQDEFLHAGGRFAKWLWAVAAIALTALLSIWI